MGVFTNRRRSSKTQEILKDKKNMSEYIENLKKKVLLPLLGEKFVQNYDENKNGLSILLVGSFLIGYLGCKYVFLGLVAGAYFYLKNDDSQETSTAKVDTTKEEKSSKPGVLICEDDESENATWLNDLLKDMWPHIAFHITRVLQQQIQPMVQEMEPKALLSTFKFTEVHISPEAPSINSINSYRPTSGKKSENKIILDMVLDCDKVGVINCMFSKEILGFSTGIPVGIMDLCLKGQARIELGPLLNGPPFFGSMAVGFTQTPETSFDLTGVGNLVEIPGLHGIIKSTVDGVLNNLFVKNKLIIPMVPPNSEIATEHDLKPMDLMHPKPKGCIFVHAIKAENLIAKDNKKAFGMKLSKGKSDPYLIIELPVRGNQSFKTKIIKENLNPVWDEQNFCFLTDTPSVEKFKITAMDYDGGVGNDDDYLGQCEIACKDFYPNFKKNKDGYPLKEVKHGRVYLDFYYLPIVDKIQNIRATPCQKTIVS